MKTDLYNKVTDQIIAALEQGVRPWMKPWSAEHAAERITRPLRANGTPYQGINVLVLWGDAVSKGYSAPIWMTFRQALELDAHVRKRERGSTVVYASKITRTGTDARHGGQRVGRQVHRLRKTGDAGGCRRIAAKSDRGVALWLCRGDRTTSESGLNEEPVRRATSTPAICRRWAPARRWCRPPNTGPCRARCASCNGYLARRPWTTRSCARRGIWRSQKNAQTRSRPHRRRS
jgi:hypothetical protein